MSAFTYQFRFAVQSNRLVSSDNEVFYIYILLDKTQKAKTTSKCYYLFYIQHIYWCQWEATCVYCEDARTPQTAAICVGHCHIMRDVFVKGWLLHLKTCQGKRVVGQHMTNIAQPTTYHVSCGLLTILDH